MKPQSFSVPNPPSVNNLYWNARAGKGRIKTDRYKLWEQAAGWELKAAKLTPIAGPYELTILVGRKDKRKTDLANREKAISDLMVKHRVVQDDSDLQHLVMRWGGTPGRTTVTFLPVKDGAP